MRSLVGWRVSNISHAGRQTSRGYLISNGFEQRKIVEMAISSRARHMECMAMQSPLDSLHDDLFIIIMSKLISSATSPSHFFNATLVCKRLCQASKDKQVLSQASSGVLTIKASKWCKEALRFWETCANAGSSEACYALGMIHFYCLMQRTSGVTWLSKAASASHPLALHALGVIHFNGSGGTRKNKNLRAGVILCARAAVLGHIDSMREVGLCLQDGYGVKKNVREGKRYLIAANTREAQSAAKELASNSFVSSESGDHNCLSDTSHLANIFKLCRNHEGPIKLGTYLECFKSSLSRSNQGSILSDYGCNVPPPKIHFVNSFMVEWSACHPPPLGIGLCSYGGCGRVESRRHEFRRCSICGSVNYCSRACQALDWKARHRHKCNSVANGVGQDDQNDVDDINDDNTFGNANDA